jgi:7-cyano-7-deazaguanine synthase in queuosine biosynthesis
MEVLYLDTQRKLSELQTEFRTKETEHENEIHSMQTDYKQRLETEIAEKKQIAKELVRIKFLPNIQ